MSMPCPTCDGGNLIGIGPCATCGGSGRVGPVAPDRPDPIDALEAVNEVLGRWEQIGQAMGGRSYGPVIQSIVDEVREALEGAPS